MARTRCGAVWLLSCCGGALIYDAATILFGGPLVTWDRRDFKKLFPAISKELESSGGSAVEAGEESVDEPLRGFMPGPEDYLSRCKTDEEAMEVINFLHSRGEISGEVFDRLRRQVEERGVRSFGPLREDNYYLKKYGNRRSR